MKRYYGKFSKINSTQASLAMDLMSHANLEMRFFHDRTASAHLHFVHRCPVVETVAFLHRR